MSQPSPIDFWFAVNNTEIISLPSRHLETFGATELNYHLVSELMDTTAQVRVRVGRIQANRPQIITPEHLAKIYMEGFGEQAQQYVDWIREHEKDVRALQYGYKLKQESFSEHLVTDSLQAVTERVTREVKEKNDPFSAVLVGVDHPWDVCLVKLFYEIIQRSAKSNIEQMERRHLFDPATLTRRNVEAAFLKASRNPALIPALGSALQKYGLFDEYQDRFFSLVKSGASAVWCSQAAQRDRISPFW